MSLASPLRTPAAPADAERAAPTITDREFRRFRDAIHREAGINLGPGKRALLVGRLAARLRALGGISFTEYFDRTERDPAERVRMLDLVTTNETHFFREPQHFQYLAEQVFPRWAAEAAAGRRPRRVRAWSAACSTGQEVYTLAMLLLDHFPAADGWDVRVLGTDLSTRVLETARAGIWPLHLSAEIPLPYRKRYMLRGTNAREGTMAAGPELRAVVDFRRLNLMDDTYAAVDDHDLVFCRNVLIYFDPETRARVVERLADRLATGGYLMLGHAEALNASTPRLVRAHPAVFQRAPEGRP